MGLKAKDLAKVGEALFGPQWQTPLAKALWVGDRTMRRWAAEDGETPDGAVDDIRRLCMDRATDLLKIATNLETKGKP